MGGQSNRRIILRARPDGVPRETDFECRTDPMPEVGEGQFLSRNLYLSLDAGFRQWMNEGAGDGYLPAMELGQPVMGLVLGEVVASKHADYAVGDLVMGRTRWEEYSLADGSDYMTKLTAVPGLSLSHFLGVLGATGLTAYFGLRDCAALQPGDVVLVSTAAGAVGSVASQIAKIEGCRVIGLTSTEAKCRWLVDELGLDAAIDYRTPGSLEAGLDRHCPDGIDVYFDNVGGDLLDTALGRLRERGRVVMCGSLSSYDTVEPRPGPQNMFKVITQRATLKGFMVTDYVAEYPAAIEKLAGWLADGRLKAAEEVVDGIERTPQAWCDMFRGKNRGKLAVRLAEPTGG